MKTLRYIFCLSLLLLSAPSAHGQGTGFQQFWERWQREDLPEKKLFGESREACSVYWWYMLERKWHGEAVSSVPLTPALIAEAQDNESNNYQAVLGEPKLPSAEQQMVAAYNGFCMRLFQEMLQTEQGNVMLSPTQLASMLCGVGKAVPESVGRQIAQCFGTESLDSVQTLLSQVQDIIDRTDTFALLPHRSVLLANKRVFAKNELPTSFPKGTVARTNFSRPKHLQSLCGSGTAGEALDSLLRANPAAPAYLLGQAKLEAKEPAYTEFHWGVTVQPDTFFMPDGAPLLVPTRKEKATLLCRETDQFIQTFYPYGWKRCMGLSFVVPKQDINFEQLVSAFVADSTVQRCERIAGAEFQHRIYMKIPCFSYGKTLSLKHVLTSAGLGALFKNPVLELKDLRQQVQFEHTLKGSYPTSAGYPYEEGYDWEGGPNARPPHIYLVANRPFIYYVFDQETGLLHLIGAYRGE